MSPLSSLLNRGKSDGDTATADGTVEAMPQRLTPTSIRVNLLPPEIAEAEHFRRGQVARGAAVLVAAGAVGGLFFAASQGVTSAQSDLDAAQDRSAQLQVQVNALSEVPRTLAAVSAAETRLTTAMGNEVQWSHYLNALGMTTPSGVAFQELNVTQDVDAIPVGAALADPTDPAAAAAAAAPSSVTSALGNPGIATVTFSGEARRNNSIAVFLDRLAANEGNIDPYFSQATTDEDADSQQEVVTFEASVTVDESAKSGRYTQEVG